MASEKDLLAKIENQKTEIQNLSNKLAKQRTEVAIEQRVEKEVKRGVKAELTKAAKGDIPFYEVIGIQQIGMTGNSALNTFKGEDGETVSRVIGLLLMGGGTVMSFQPKNATWGNRLATAGDGFTKRAQIELHDKGWAKVKDWVS